MDRQSKQSLSEFDVLPPLDLDSEMCVLGSLLLAADDPSTRMEILAALKPEDFYNGDHQIYFRVLGEMDRAGEQIDAMTFRTALDRRKVLEEVGGVAYLAQILHSVPSPAHWRQYAASVRDASIKRQVLKAANAAKQAIYAASREANGAELAEKAMRQLSEIIAGTAQCEFKTVGALVQEVKADMDAGGEETILTGFRDLDAQTNGIRVGEMWIVAARPSVGKSTFVRQIALNMARAGVPVAMISLEEGDKKIARNLLSNLTEIDNKRLRSTANIHEEEWRQIEFGIQEMAELPLYILSNTRRMSDIRAAVSILAARHGVKVVIVDYLQRVGCGITEEYAQVSFVSQALSDLFKEVKVAGIAVAQPNRANEGRDEKRLGMSDLRGSGKLEQDADAILMLHREDYYKQNNPKYPGYQPDHKAEVIIAKMRDGERNKTIWLETDMRYQKFRDCDQPQASLVENYI